MSCVSSCDSSAILILRGNLDLGGTISTEIGQMRSLGESVVNESHNGACKRCIPNPSWTERLHCGGTSLSGNIPIEIGNLSRLTSLELDDVRDLSGTIPSELGRLTALGKAWEE